MTPWHPAHDARELEPGVWQFAVTAGRPGRPGYAVWPYAEIRFLHIGGEQGYRAVVWDEVSPRQLVGYYRSLRAACAAAHRAQDGLRRARHPGRDPLTGGVMEQGRLVGGVYGTSAERSTGQR